MSWNLEQIATLYKAAKEMRRLLNTLFWELVKQDGQLSSGKVHLITGETVLYSGLESDDEPHKKG